jgi:2-succinyl-5-enolpyruvyl-6-hydroxy-3-cyclohexene-1-carboxylate synthase
MNQFYSDEVNAQIVIALLKAHGIRKVIASPGTTNMSVVVSMDNDPFFEMFSAVDERSAAYMACGLAAESGEPVVISCTGATASRNYLPGMTEAFYRKLPVLAITSTQNVSRVGHHIAQVIDRSVIQNDVARLSVTLPIVKDDEDRWECEISVNRALLELKRHGGGPVHINIPTTYNKLYETKELPKVRVIKRVTLTDAFPSLPQGKVAIFVGAHANMSAGQTEALDHFCATNDAVVFCDHTSGYKGKYRIPFALAGCQSSLEIPECSPELLIHIGEVTGEYYNAKCIGKQVWRVSEDGEIRDTFRKLHYIFEMPEQSFFGHYGKTDAKGADSYLQLCKRQLEALREKMPEFPFSNIWLASQMAHRIPEGSTIHFGILNSLRSWNFFDLPASVSSASNVGGFGIDGDLSTLIGASLANRGKLYYCVLGDLAFFYDMNSIGNRHVGKNLRILLINNGKGTEFRLKSHVAAQFGDVADHFIAAAGHFGRKSPNLVKHYAEDLGFEYLSASSKEEFERDKERFLSPEITDRPMLFEVFTDSDQESNALESIMKIDSSLGKEVKDMVKGALGPGGVSMLKKLFGK